MIAANKNDLDKEKHTVDKESAEELKDGIGADELVFISANTGDGVEELFNKTAQLLLSRQVIRQKSIILEESGIPNV